MIDLTHTSWQTLIAHHAPAIEHIFISDLHLSVFPAKNPSENRLMQAFLTLLTQINTLPNVQSLYILGDWFDAWLGDDMVKNDPVKTWLNPMIKALTTLHLKGCQIFVQKGNRDFLLGQDFCQNFGGQILPEPFYLSLYGKIYRLEHGDRLCTDDKPYQRFRTIIQNPLTKKILLAQPLKNRQKIANALRKKSRKSTQKKPQTIMDVNTNAVNRTLTHADWLIHGHTHRPKIHSHRIVLGDWHTNPSQQDAPLLPVHTQIGVALQPTKSLALIPAIF